MHLCGNMIPRAELCVVIKRLIKEAHTTPAVLTEVHRAPVGLSRLTSCPLSPSTLSPCDNRDIPQLVPCLATGLSLNSSKVCGMLDWRAERWGRQSQTDEGKWTTLINSGLLCLLMLEAPGCPQHICMHLHTPVCTEAGKHLPKGCSHIRSSVVGLDM